MLITDSWIWQKDMFGSVSVQVRCGLKIKIAVLLALFLMFSGTIFAQVQGNFGVTVLTPVRYIQMQALNVDIHNLLSDSHGPLPLPYAQIAYVFDRELVDVGLGYKAWVIGPMLLFPIAFADITIAKILHVEASMGGLLMTVVEGSKPAWLLPIPLLVSEFGMYIKVYETFQTGISCLVPAYIADKLYFSCVVCVALRFVLDDF